MGEPTSTREGWRILTVWVLWAAREERVLPHSPPPHERWNLEHVVLDLFSHMKTGKIKWFLLQSSLSLGSGFCNLFELFASFAQLFVLGDDHVRSCQ